MKTAVLVGASKHHLRITQPMGGVIDGMPSFEADLPPELGSSALRTDEEIGRLCTDRLLRGDVVVCVQTPEAEESEWVRGELAAAEALGLPVVYMTPEEWTGKRGRELLHDRLRKASEEADRIATERYHEEAAVADRIGECGPTTPHVIHDATEQLAHRVAARSAAVVRSARVTQDRAGPPRVAPEQEDTADLYHAITWMNM